MRIYYNLKNREILDYTPESLTGATVPLPEGHAEIGEDATFPDGTTYGIFVKNPNDKNNPAVELNEAGARWILTRAGGDVAKARRIAKEEGYIIPE